MSVSKWAYIPGVCDDQICPGDCDLCSVPERYLDDEDEDDELRYECEFEEERRGYK